MDIGPSHTVMHSVMPAASSASALTGTRMRFSPIPAAFMAINSLSADMRPKPISTPTSTPMGTLKVSTRGNALRKRSAIWRASPECRATTFMICTSCGTKMTKVKMPSPSSAWERTSRKM